MPKVVKVWRYDYTMPDASGRGTADWTAHIAGNTEDECRDILFKIVGKNVNVMSISEICRLDAISDNLRTQIVEAATPQKKKPGRPPKKK